MKPYDSTHKKLIVIMQIQEEVIRQNHRLWQMNPETAQWTRVFGLLVLSFVPPYLFILYLETITYTLWGGLAFVGALLLGFFVTVFVRSGLNEQWLIELVWALVLLSLCAWLVSIPMRAIDPSVIDAANEAPLFEFLFGRLNSWERCLVVSQMVGMWFVALTAVAILLRGLHTLSLAMADPKNPNGLSLRIALFTMRTSGWQGIVMMMIFGTLAWYFLVAAQNPDAFIWSTLYRCQIS